MPRLGLDKGLSICFNYLVTQTSDRTQRLLNFARQHGNSDITHKQFKDIVEASNDNMETDMQLLDRETNRLSEKLYEVLPSIHDDNGN